MILSLIRSCLNAFLLLWAISILAFWLSKLVPGDEVMEYLTIDEPRYNINSNPLEFQRAYQQIAHRRGLDLPLFYWSVSPSYFPRGINLLLPLDERKTVISWIEKSKKGKLSLTLHDQLQNGLQLYCPSSISSNINDILCRQFNIALQTRDINLLQKNMIILNDLLLKDSNVTPEIKNHLAEIIISSTQLSANGTQESSTGLFPLLQWNGTNNQYHQWMSGLLSQQPLTSLVDGLNAWRKIYDAFKWTMILNGLAFLLAILAGVFIGIWSGNHHGQLKERIVSWILFALFALPSFWLGTLFIYALTSGEWLSVFPSGGLGAYQQAGSLPVKWAILFAHLVLPVACLTLGALAYVSRQTKQSMLHQWEQPYVKALRAQGISENTIMRKHVIRNALFPVITIIGGSIPALLSGSLIVEVIFSIPGMGRLMYTSLLAHDWPVVFPVLMLGAAITIFSYALTDIVYKWADPRVKTM